MALTVSMIRHSYYQSSDHREATSTRLPAAVIMLMIFTDDIPYTANIHTLIEYCCH